MGQSARQVEAWGLRALGAAVLAVAVLSVSGRPAGATLRYGALQLSGNFETQNLVQHPDLQKFQFVQNRNTFRLRVDWDWLQNQRFIDKYNIPFIERSKLYILYRGVYDGYYDITPGGNQIGQTHLDDPVGGPIAGNTLGNCLGGDPCVAATQPLKHGHYSRFDDAARSAAKFENRLREAYIDFKLKDAPLSFRIGRQQVIWGESDQFRIMDIWNPLDITWHFQQESWDNIRIPQWIAKGLWDIGEIGPLSNVFFEAVYNPFDFQPGIKAAFLPQPWALPFANPLRTGQVANQDGKLLSPVFDLQGTSLRQGDFKRNPRDASEVGARLHAVTPQGFEFAVNYLYGRGRGVGAASPFAVKIERMGFDNGFPVPAFTGRYQLDINNPADIRDVSPLNLHAKVIHPYMHIFGLTGNYFEGDYLQTVLRFEMAYAMGEPFQTTDPATRVAAVNCSRTTGQCFPAPFQYGFSPLGFTKRDVWAGMIGFDRPTWIRWLNPRATWFLSGQFFWNFTTGGHIDQLVGNAGTGDAPYYGSNDRFGHLGVWRTGPFAGQIERMQRGTTTTRDGTPTGKLVDPLAIGNGDNIRQWEHLVTIAATSFYRGGTVVPFVANAWDPVNSNNEVLWNLDYYYTNDLIFTFQQKFFSAFGRGKPSNDPWYAGGRFHRRDETGVKITYQF